MLHFKQKQEVQGMDLCKKKPVLISYKKIEEPFDVETLEGVMQGKAGDYLIRGVEGELYLCDAGIFDRTYDKIN